MRGPQASDQVEVATLPPASADSQAQSAYSQAYGRLIAEDLDGAEAAFSGFLKRFPSHELAGNAQYWLAESHFVRGQFASAAREFLTGYRTYASSPKAPESLLKLGLSLTALGRKDEACSSLREVAERFPQAPSAVHERAASEQINAGC
ncbi:MAG: tol-pal system protein YbgF [Rhizobiales bacterium]|nr:tol-pal system protein YbgF [Hyphomicrobiales bacterium]